MREKLEEHLELYKVDPFLSRSNPLPGNAGWEPFSCQGHWVFITSLQAPEMIRLETSLRAAATTEPEPMVLQALDRPRASRADPCVRNAESTAVRFSSSMSCAMDLRWSVCKNTPVA